VRPDHRPDDAAGELIENQKKAGGVPAGIDAVHLARPGFGQDTSPRDQARRAGLRPHAAIEPNDRRRDGAPLGLSRCLAGRQECRESRAIATPQANLGAMGAAETMTNDHGCRRRALEGKLGIGTLEPDVLGVRRRGGPQQRHQGGQRMLCHDASLNPDLRMYFAPFGRLGKFGQLAKSAAMRARSAGKRYD
jgi:hypothetical protein